MKKAQPMIMMSIIFALVVMLFLQNKQHEREMLLFRQSVRSITVAARAKDADTGEYLPCRVLSFNSGEELGYSTSWYSDQGIECAWITTGPKTFQLTSPGYNTQSFVAASSWTNVVAHLNRLEKSSNTNLEPISGSQ